MNFLRTSILIIIGIGMIVIGVIGYTNARHVDEDVTPTVAAFPPVTSTPGSNQPAAPATEPPINATDSASSEETPVADMSTSHIVRQGETISDIARNYGLTVQEIAGENDISNPDIIFNGQILIIPATPCVTEVSAGACPPQPTPSPMPSPTPTSTAAAQSENTAQSGGTGTGNDVTTTDVNISTPITMTETRIIQVSYPKNMTLGESVKVAIIFNVKAAGSQGENGDGTTDPTDTPDFRADFGEVSHYEGYNLYAVARLDAPGFDTAPASDLRRLVRPGEKVVYHWSVQSLKAEKQTLVISLWLEYEPKRPNLAPFTEGLFWSDGFPVEVKKTIFGITASVEQTLFMLIGGGGLLPIFSAVGSVYKFIANRNGRRSGVNEASENNSRRVSQGLGVRSAEGVK